MPFRKVAANFKLFGAEHPKICYIQGVTKRMDGLTYYIMLGGLILFWPPCRISQIMIFNHFLQGLSTQS